MINIILISTLELYRESGCLGRYHLHLPTLTSPTSFSTSDLIDQVFGSKHQLSIGIPPSDGFLDDELDHGLRTGESFALTFTLISTFTLIRPYKHIYPICNVTKVASPPSYSPHQIFPQDLDDQLMREAMQWNCPFEKWPRHLCRVDGDGVSDGDVG